MIIFNSELRFLLCTTSKGVNPIDLFITYNANFSRSGQGKSCRHSFLSMGTSIPQNHFRGVDKKSAGCEGSDGGESKRKVRKKKGDI